MSCRGARTCENHRPSWVCGGLVLLHLNAVGCRRERLVVPAGRMYMYRLYVRILADPVGLPAPEQQGRPGRRCWYWSRPRRPRQRPHCFLWPLVPTEQQPTCRALPFVSTSVTCDVTTDSPSEPSRQRRNDHRANDPSSWHALMHGREARDRAGVGRALLGRYRRGADGIGALVVEIGTAAGGIPTQARLAVSHCMSRLDRPRRPSRCDSSTTNFQFLNFILFTTS